MARFFVISGSHGVGKSTVAGLVAQMMEEGGKPLMMFHHRAEKAKAGDTPPTPGERPAWQRKLWRSLPTLVRTWLIASLDELGYARSIKLKIKLAARTGRPAISDRYIYDRLVDLRIHGRSAQQVRAVALACRFMRKPDMTFLLTDTPERIYGRKDELAIDQIATYQEELAALLVRLGVPFVEIAVSGRAAEAVAHDVTNLIRNSTDDPS